MFKVLHTADLHLDSSFADLPLAESERARQSQLRSFLRMIEIAKEESVSLFCIAGDLFDRERVRPAVADAVFDALASLDCPVVISPGNHDPYRSGSVYAERELPKNLFVFREETLSHVDFPSIGRGVRVYGYAFSSPSLYASPLMECDRACMPTDGGVSILLCHADLDHPLSSYAPLMGKDIERCLADYVALGHTHNVPDELLVFGDTLAAYAGFPEGRSFDECGFGSFRLLTFDPDAVYGERIASACRVSAAAHRYAVETLDVTGATSDEDVIARLQSLTQEKVYGEETTLRVILSGEVAVSYTPDLRFIASGLAGDGMPLFSDLRDETLPILDSGYLEQDISIRGELYRMLKAEMQEGTMEARADAAMALRLALAALDGRPIV